MYITGVCKRVETRSAIFMLPADLSRRKSSQVAEERRQRERERERSERKDDKILASRRLFHPSFLLLDPKVHGSPNNRYAQLYLGYQAKRDLITF